MPKQEEPKGHSNGELYGVFRHGKWVTHAPVFTERQNAESWLMTRRPPDGYKDAVIKNLRAEARDLRKKAAKVLTDAEQESANLLAAGQSDSELYGVFHKGKLVNDAPVFTEQQTAEIWLLMQKRKPLDGFKGVVVKSLKAETKERRKKAARVLVDAQRESTHLLAVAKQLDAVSVPLPGTDFVGVELERPKASRGSYSSFAREKNTSVVSGGLPGLGKKR
ncbi:hypothetical protein [Burkholderia pseudomultivorans]|uniref:hypothetical protein n=1 Tax=Burkholderia pseudomultivorans TaxID=1207504 RepID=UPI0018905DF9|nr:hypothetical protein [Burkholderia pseudomultivorans]MBF5008732.1 hypothetical protein [Burkholderia pseudomultivorans]